MSESRSLIVISSLAPARVIVIALALGAAAEAIRRMPPCREAR
ncbi:hypothetical protein [Nocardiopsis sp. CNT-189]